MERMFMGFARVNLVRITVICVSFAAIVAYVPTCNAADVTSIWNFDAVGDWTSANWSSANYPNNGNGGFTYDALIGSGIVTLDQDIAIEALTNSGGTIAGPSNLTINNLMSWTGGTMGGAGITAIADGGMLSLPSGAQLLQRTLVNEGSTQWTGTGQ